MKTFDLTLTFTEDLLGGSPKNLQVYTDYVASKRPPDQDLDEEMNDLSFTGERGSTGFPTDSEGVFLLDYQVKGFFKEAGYILKDIVGVHNLKNKLQYYFWIAPRKIRLAPKIDGVLERPLRGMTPLGPRVALAQSDRLDQGLMLKCEIALFEHKELTEDLLRKLLDYGIWQGMGQWRSGGYGRFTYELTERS